MVRKVIRATYPEVDPSVHECQERNQIRKRETHSRQDDVLPDAARSSVGSLNPHGGLYRASCLSGLIMTVPSAIWQTCFMIRMTFLQSVRPSRADYVMS